MVKKKKKILIALPCYRTMEAESVNSLCQLLLWSENNLADYSIEFKIAARQQVVVARNGLAKYALDNKFDYVLFLDDDHVWPKDVLKELLTHKKEAVSALYFRRTPPYGAVMFKGVCLSNSSIHYERIPPSGEGLIEVDAVGMGCFLLKIKTLKKLSYPFFVLEDRRGSDMHFSQRLREKDIKIYVDMDLAIGHLGDRPVVDKEAYFLFEENKDIGSFFKEDITAASPPCTDEEKFSVQDKLKQLKLRVEVNPENSEALRALGLGYVALKKFNKAVAAFKEAISYAHERKQKKYELSSSYYLGEVFLKQKKYSLAKTAFERCLELEPNHKMAKKQLGNCKK